MLVKVPQVTAQQASVQDVAIGQLSIGPVTVGELVLSNASLAFSAVQASLQNLSVKVSLHITFDWHIHVGLPDGIPDINIGDSYDLGTLEFGVTVGNVLIPGLNGLNFQVPSLSATNVTAKAAPTPVQLGRLQVDGVTVSDVAAPAAGFSLTGLALSSLSGTGLGVPAATASHVAVAHVHGDPLTIPTLTITGVTLPSIKIPSISSAAPITVPAVLPTNSVGFDAGVLRAAIHITPTVTSHIDHLQISGATASASTGDIVLHNVTLPFDALNLTLSQLGIQTIAVPSFTVA